MSFSSLKWYIVITLLALILGILIFLTIKSGAKKAETQKSISENLSIFDSINSSLTGKIINVEEKKIVFENQKGVKSEATLSQDIMISNLSVKDPLPPSNDPSKIELNKTANMIFKIQDGKYYITSITFPPP